MSALARSPCLLHPSATRTAAGPPGAERAPGARGCRDLVDQLLVEAQRLLGGPLAPVVRQPEALRLEDAGPAPRLTGQRAHTIGQPRGIAGVEERDPGRVIDRKSTRLNSSHVAISYAVFCLKKN